jgi:hypothetical protein
MKTMTIIAEPKNTNNPDADAIKWKDFLAKLDAKVSPHTKGKKKPIENLWQIPLEPGMKILIEIQPAAIRSEVRLAVHVSDELLDFSILP